MASSLEDALVAFFKSTSVSSSIVRKLAATDEPVPHAELVHAVNAMMVHLVPDYAFAGSASNVLESLESFEPTINTGLKLLIDSGIVTESSSMCTLSDVGEELHRRISD